MTWHYAIQCVEQHWESITIFGGLLLTSTIRTMPPPGSVFNRATMYKWLYDNLHQFLNMRNPTQQ
jgi:hypothetical protein